MDTWNSILAVLTVLVFIFTIVIDVLLARELIQRHRNKQGPHEPPKK